MTIKSKKTRNNPNVEAEIIENVEGIFCCANKGSSLFKLLITSRENCEANGIVNFKLIPDNGNCAVPINQVVAEVFLEVNITDKDKNYNISHLLKRIPRTT